MPQNPFDLAEEQSKQPGSRPSPSNPFDEAEKNLLLGIPGFKAAAARRAQNPSLMPGEMSVGEMIFSSIPIAAGTLSAPFTGGMSLLSAIGTSALIGAGSKALEEGGRAITGVNPPRSVGEAAKEIGLEGLLFGISEPVGRIAARPLEYLGEKFSPTALYQRAIKPVIGSAKNRRRLGEVEQLVETGVSKEIQPSAQGFYQLRDDIKELNARISQKIKDKSATLGDVIDPQTIGRRVLALKKYFGQQGAPKEDLDAIQEVYDQYIGKHSYKAPFTKIRPAGGGGPGAAPGSGFTPTGPGNTTVFKPYSLAEAQAEKQTTNVMNRGKFGSLSSARPEAEKQLAYALRRKITQLFPEVAALNREDQGMILLETELRRFVVREGNREAIPLTAAAMAGHGKGLWAAAIGALQDPRVKALLAFNIRRASNTPVLGRVLGQLGPSNVLRGGIKGVGALGLENPDSTK